MNLKSHVHALVIDGEFSRDGPERATFHPVHPPDVYALEIVIDRVYRRLVAWLGRHGLLTKVDDEVESHEVSALEATLGHVRLGLERERRAELVPE